MKKLYINPKFEIIKIQMNQHLLDGSINVTLDKDNTQENESALGRDFDFDDEDEY